MQSTTATAAIRSRVSLSNSRRIDWHKPAKSPFFNSVSCDGYPLVFRGSYGAMSALLSVDNLTQEPVYLAAESTTGPVRSTLRHRLARVRPAGGETVLVAEVTLRNAGTHTETVALSFATSAHPARSYGAEHIHLPLTAGPHSDLRDLGMTELWECERQSSGTVAH